MYVIIKINFQIYIVEILNEPNFMATRNPVVINHRRGIHAVKSRDGSISPTNEEPDSFFWFVI